MSAGLGDIIFYMENEFSSTLRVEENWKKHFTEVTTVSKYIALFLFVTLPFLGFWLGIKYEAMQSAGMNDGMYEGLPNNTVTLPVPNAPGDSLGVIQASDISDGVMPLFRVVHTSEGQQYDEGRLVIPLLYDAPCCDTYRIELQRYDQSLEQYETIISDLSTVANYKDFGGFEYVEGQNLYEHVLSKMATIILGWSNDGRYVYMIGNLYEGYNPSYVYYIDTEDIEAGIQKVEGYILYGSPDVVLSPDKDKMYVFADEDVEEYKSVSVIHLSNREVTDVYSLSDEASTFMLNGWWGPEPMIQWIDENTLQVSVVLKDNLQQCEFNNCLYSDEDYQELATKVTTLEFKVD